jgi:tetratricopeptide (TPR) repeat protein
MGDVFWQQHDTSNALNHYREAIRLTPSYMNLHPLHEFVCKVYCNIGRTHLYRYQYDSAIWYGNQSAKMGGNISAVTDLFWGEMAQYQKQQYSCYPILQSAASHSLNHENNHRVALECYERLSEIYQNMHFADSSMHYARNAFTISTNLRNTDDRHRACLRLALLFKEQKMYDSAFNYQQKALELYPLQVNSEKERLTLNAYFNSKINKQTLTAQEKQTSLRNWIFVMLGTLVLLTLLIVFYRTRLQSTHNRKMKEVEMRALRAQMKSAFYF